MLDSIRRPDTHSKGLVWELENICPCGSGELMKDCCNRD
jgi:hypothetical protein